MPGRLSFLSLVVAGVLPAMAAYAQAPVPEAMPVVVPDDLARALPCDDEAGRVLGEWLLHQSDPVMARGVVDLLAADNSSCAAVRNAAISLVVTLGLADDSAAWTRPGPIVSSAVPEAYLEAEQQAERLTFSVSPPPRNLTRNVTRTRIYAP